MYLLIELGGTTTVIGFSSTLVIDHTTQIADIHEFPTNTPLDVFNTIKSLCVNKEIEAISVAAFGPVIIDRKSPDFGLITTTPKTKWRNCSIVDHLRSISSNIFIDTDVNSAAAAELHGRLSRGISISDLKYITVGTGIGVGSFVSNSPSRATEGGHIHVEQFPDDLANGFVGVCPFHRGCVEGMANAEALATRANCSVMELPQLDDDNLCFEAFAHYLAHLCVSITLLSRPDTIVLSGGVFKRQSLHNKVCSKFDSIINEYIDVKGSEVLEKPVFDRSGLVGALAIITI
ncbi:hypothetical protein GEMRC1_004017 [Eukaryota sp. GEM-RC1]